MNSHFVCNEKELSLRCFLTMACVVTQAELSIVAVFIFVGKGRVSSVLKFTKKEP